MELPTNPAPSHEDLLVADVGLDGLGAAGRAGRRVIVLGVLVKAVKTDRRGVTNRSRVGMMLLTGGWFSLSDDCSDDSDEPQSDALARLGIDSV